VDKLSFFVFITNSNTEVHCMYADVVWGGGSGRLVDDWLF